MLAIAQGYHQLNDVDLSGVSVTDSGISALGQVLYLLVSIYFVAEVSLIMVYRLKHRDVLYFLPAKHNI